MATTLSQFEDHSIPSAPKEFSVWVSKEHNHLSKACFNLQCHRFSQKLFIPHEANFRCDLSCVRWSRNALYPLNQSNAILSPTTTWSSAFFPRVCRLVFTMSFRWLFTVFCYLLIGGHDYFDIPLRILSRKAC